MSLKLQGLEEINGTPDRQAGEMVKWLLVNEDMAGGAIKASAMAARAGLIRLIFGQLLADTHRIGFEVTPLHIGDHALKAVSLSSEGSP